MVFIDEFEMSNFLVTLFKQIWDACDFNQENKNQAGGENNILIARLPICSISNNPPTNITMSLNDIAAILRRLLVIHVDQYPNDEDFQRRPLRFIRSMATAHEPLTLAEVSSFPYENPVLHPSKLEPPVPLLMQQQQQSPPPPPRTQIAAATIIPTIAQIDAPIFSLQSARQDVAQLNFNHNSDNYSINAPVVNAPIYSQMNDHKNDAQNFDEFDISTSELALLENDYNYNQSEVSIQTIDSNTTTTTTTSIDGPANSTLIASDASDRHHQMFLQQQLRQFSDRQSKLEEEHRTLKTNNKVKQATKYLTDMRDMASNQFYSSCPSPISAEENSNSIVQSSKRSIQSTDELDEVRSNNKKPLLHDESGLSFLLRSYNDSAYSDSESPVNLEGYHF